MPRRAELVPAAAFFRPFLLAPGRNGPTIGATVTAPSLAIETRGLGRRYGRRWALVDVDLDVGRGTSLLVAGRNGSGKSTLLRVLSTATRPDRGRATIEGHDLQTAKQEVRRRIALLGHATYAYEALSALQNLQVTADLIGKRTGRKELVDLGRRVDDSLSTFSAGMRKRLSIARLLLQEATVVMLDEPYAALDPEGFRFIDALLERLKARGTTVLLVSHLLDRGAAFCDRGIVLDEGRVAWSGPARELPAHGGLDPARIPEGA
jgi:heme exporter protein A